LTKINIKILKLLIYEISFFTIFEKFFKRLLTLKKIIKLTCLLFLFNFLLFKYNLFAQLNVDFYATPTKGCVPLTVSFYIQTQIELSYIFWDFGNGNYSNLPNPTVNYINYGSYTITLIVSDGIIYDTIKKVDYINVYNKPTASFTYQPQYGCVPLTVNFSNTSTIGNAPINSFIWNFGDGSISTAQNPIHVYNLAGTYNVTLTVTDTNNCSSSITINNAIIVSSYPTANFTANITTSCAPPFTVDFINQSSGMGSLSYIWHFGDGNTSSQQNPSHTYTSYGTFDVTLIVINQYGCSDTLTKNNFIKIQDIEASFSIMPSDTVCPNQPVEFINESGTAALWSFGDNNASTQPNPIHSYTNPGTYTVMMIAEPGSICQDTAYKTIYVRPYPDAQFSFNINYTCGNPITFTPNNLNGTSYVWNFGDSNTSTSISPTYTYSINKDTFYYVSLTITDIYGCTNTYQHPQPIIIDKINTEIISSDENGCKPLTVNFSANSDIDTNYIQITSWSWNFGNNNSSNLPNPTFTFQDTGMHIISLTITTDLGCTSTAYDTILVGEKQTPIISYSISEICANDTIKFTSLSVDSNYIDNYSWTFINQYNETVATSTDKNPEIEGFNGIGYITIVHTVEHNGCYNSTSIDSAFKINGPYIKKIDTIMVGCHNPYLIGVVIKAQELNRLYIDMDNNGTFEDSVVFFTPIQQFTDTFWYEYPTNSYFTINVIAYNDSTGCNYEANKTIKILDIKAELTVQSPSCPQNVLFNFINSQDYDVNSILFNYGDGNYGNYPIYTYPLQSANYTVYLYLQNGIGCKDTDSVYLRIFYPKPGFIIDNHQFCPPFTVNFVDTSTADTTIIFWEWNINPPNINLYDQNISYTFTNPGNYTVSLKVIDAIGCQATYTATNGIQALSFNAQFIAQNTKICKNDTVKFISNVQYANLYIWDYGDGSIIDTALNPIHQYTDTGNFTVTLIIQAPYPNCIDTLIKHNYISVQDIDIEFLSSITDTNCYPAIVTFMNNTNTNYEPTWFWFFGDGNVSTLQNPQHIYSLPGEYWVILEGTTSYGCKDKDSLKITINGPYTEIIADKNQICKGDTINFSVTNSEGISIFNWDFGDGASSNQPNPSHAYNFVPPNGELVASLIYCSEVGCCQFDTLKVNIHQVFADFSYTLTNQINDSSACGSSLLSFTNNSQGANTYTWYLEDSIIYNVHTPQPIMYYNNSLYPKTYNISLSINSVIGCKDSISKIVIIYPLPKINVCNDTIICKGDTAFLWASGGTQYEWLPNNYLNNNLISNPYALPESDITYSIIVSNEYSCSSTSFVSIKVIQPPSLIISNDTTIIIGESVNLWAITDQTNVSYYWEPNTYLSCYACSNPISKPLKTITYVLTIKDSLNCFEVKRDVTINVVEEFSLDVPLAFTPNGDGINDKVYVRGWGIKRLIEFKIFNRWGECVFETNNLLEGWDGTFKGKKANIDTYVYYVKAEMYNGKIYEKKGTITLLN